MSIDKKLMEACLICESLYPQKVMSHDRWALYDGHNSFGEHVEVAAVEGWLCPACGEKRDVDELVYDMLANSIE